MNEKCGRSDSAPHFSRGFSKTHFSLTRGGAVIRPTHNFKKSVELLEKNAKKIVLNFVFENFFRSILC